VTSTHPESLTVREIFQSGRYVVPIYQRAYAWGVDQIETLLRDVCDYRNRGHRQYFIGSLVTHLLPTTDESVATFEVVDGQQRLNTLFLTLSILGTADTRPSADLLTYEGRARSAADLARLARTGPATSVDDLEEFGIKVGLETILAAQKRGDFTHADLDYLLDSAHIVRTTLPTGTDLNHYFEVMNSRGEQLEKHEIVKASLMGRLAALDDADTATRTFARVWDACSDLTRHVQRGFTPRERKALFGADWDTPSFTSFGDVATAVSVAVESENQRPRTLGALLAAKPSDPGKAAEDSSDATERYGAIIDFPNLLLQVLAVHVGADVVFDWSGSAPIPLDDKQLVREFERQLSTAKDVKEFTVRLLRLRYLFDRFVIKTDRSRESEDDSNWVLVRARNHESKLSPVATFGLANDDEAESSNAAHAHVVLLQSMFQVTDSRRSYKNFLFAILQFLNENSAPSADEYVAFFQVLASQRLGSAAGADLDAGTSVPHFQFNYLDYLLWLRASQGDASLAHIGWSSYRFRYRTSIERFYPQHPDPGGNIEPLGRAIVDLFGNLCLMSRSENSKRSNLAPEAKVGQYRSDAQSLKFQLMAAVARDEGWREEQIRAHGEAMLTILSGLKSPPEATASKESTA